MKINNKTRFFFLYLVLVLFLSITFFRGWFDKDFVAGYEQELLTEGFYTNSYFPSFWQSHKGFGGINPQFFIRLPQFLSFYLFGKVFPVNYSLIVRMVYCLPIVLLGSLSIYYTLVTITKEYLYSLLGAVFFMSNTFFLTRVSGGQTPLISSYIFFPLIFVFFYKYINSVDSKKTTYLLISALAFSFQAFYEIRICYIAFWALFSFSLIEMVFSANERRKVSVFFDWIKQSVKTIFIFGIVFFLLHGFWIIPGYLLGSIKGIPFPKNFEKDIWMDYYSANRINNLIMNRNVIWPSTDVRKSYTPEIIYLFYPLALVALLLNFETIKKKTGFKMELFSFFILLLGVFLTKGTRAPFGKIYKYLFFYFPGFRVFREPSKFDILIIFSNSLIICYFTQLVFSFMNKLWYKGFYAKKILTFLVVFSFIFYPVYKDFKGEKFDKYSFLLSKKNPEGYKMVETLLTSDHSSFRVLWIPRISIYGYYSSLHPFVSYYDTHFIGLNMFGGGYNLDLMSNPDEFLKLIQLTNIKYIVVPKETEEESFYDFGFPRAAILERLGNFDYLKEVGNFDQVIIFTFKNPNDFIPRILVKNENAANSDLVATFQKISNTIYLLRLRNINGPFKIIFSETFHKGWLIKTLDREKLGCLPSFFYNGDDKSFSVEECLKKDGLVGKFHFLGKQTSGIEHLEENHFNSWVVTDQFLNGRKDFQADLLIVFEPDKYYFLGVIAAILGTLSILVIIIKNSILQWKLKGLNKSIKCQ